MVVLGSGAAAAQSNVGTLKVTYSEAKGIGPTKGVMRRDPSDIIRVGDLFYVWYSKGAQSHGYNASVWYATSPDGREWTEMGEALPRGMKDSWDEQSVFTPNILVADGRYWLFYTAVPKPFIANGPKTTKTAIGIAVSDSPNGPKLRIRVILSSRGNPSALAIQPKSVDAATSGGYGIGIMASALYVLSTRTMRWFSTSPT